MRLLAALPQLFKTGNLIIKSVEGGITPAEMGAIIVEVRETIKSIPELGAFLAVFDSLVKVAAVILPTFMGDKAKVLALGLKEVDIEEALAVTKLMDQIIEEAVLERKAADGKLKDDDIEGMI
jgi:hypothetical protein